VKRRGCGELVFAWGLGIWLPLPQEKASQKKAALPSRGGGIIAACVAGEGRVIRRAMTMFAVEYLEQAHMAISNPPNSSNGGNPFAALVCAGVYASIMWRKPYQRCVS